MLPLSPPSLSHGGYNGPRKIVFISQTEKKKPKECYKRLF